MAVFGHSGNTLVATVTIEGYGVGTGADSRQLVGRQCTDTSPTYIRGFAVAIAAAFETLTIVTDQVFRAVDSRGAPRRYDFRTSAGTTAQSEFSPIIDPVAIDKNVVFGIGLDLNFCRRADAGRNIVIVVIIVTDHLGFGIGARCLAYMKNGVETRIAGRQT
jgi:hypothetical protein